MNATRFDWSGAATIAVWAALLWWTLRGATTTRTGFALKSIARLLLIGFGAVMLWNVAARML
jgi:ABC-type nickel/cobalt efflux system permease component RcnA